MADESRIPRGEWQSGVGITVMMVAIIHFFILLQSVLCVTLLSLPNA